MAAGSSKGLPKKKPKRSQGAGEEETDRFRDVPDHILHHILSFVDDAKSLARTSLLSRRWRSLWKDVPVLNFKRSCVGDIFSFSEHVDKVLAHRSHSAAITGISINFCGYSAGGHSELKLFDRIMSYAASHHDCHDLRHLSIAYVYGDIKFSKMAACIAAPRGDRRHISLETLELKWTCIERGAFATTGFDSLTTLELRGCWFSTCIPKETVDPFSILPCLNNLKLLDCTSSVRYLLKLSGLQLLHLEIQKEQFDDEEIEVFAPKLKSFCYRGWVMQLVKLNLPSLDCANIRMWWWGTQQARDQYIDAEQEEQRYMNLLRNLRNAKSLNLRFDKLGGWNRWEDHLFPLTCIKPLMEREASPFTRLRSLRVQYPQEPPDTPYQVIRYFMEGSPNTGDKFVKFERKVKSY